LSSCGLTALARPIRQRRTHCGSLFAKISAYVAIFSRDQAAGHQESTLGVVSVILWSFILARVADGQLAPVSQASAG